MSAPTSGDNGQLGTLLKSLLESRRMELLSPFLVGGWLDTLFLGLIFVAFGVWVSDVRPTDRGWHKALVAYLMVISVGSTVATLVHWDHVFMDGFGDYTVIVSTHAARAIPAFFVLLKVPSSAFFAMRAYYLQGRPIWFPILIIPILLSCTVGGIIGTVFLTAFPATKLVLDCTLMDAVTAVAADVVIASCLLQGLWKSKTGWERTDRVVKRLMWLLVETQVPPTLLTIAFLIVSLVKTDGTALGYFIFLPKVHVCNVLWNLNSRVAIAQQLSQPGSSNHYSSGRAGKLQNRNASQGHRSRFSMTNDLESGGVSTVTAGTFIPYGPASARLEEHDEVPELGPRKISSAMDRRAEEIGTLRDRDPHQNGFSLTFLERAQGNHPPAMVDLPEHAMPLYGFRAMHACRTEPTSITSSTTFSALPGLDVSGIHTVGFLPSRWGRDVDAAENCFSVGDYVFKVPVTEEPGSRMDYGPASLLGMQAARSAGFVPIVAELSIPLADDTQAHEETAKYVLWQIGKQLRLPGSCRTQKLHLIDLPKELADRYSSAGTLKCISSDEATREEGKDDWRSRYRRENPHNTAMMVSIRKWIPKDHRYIEVFVPVSQAREAKQELQEDQWGDKLGATGFAPSTTEHGLEMRYWPLETRELKHQHTYTGGHDKEALIAHIVGDSASVPEENSVVSGFDDAARVQQAVTGGWTRSTIDGSDVTFISMTPRGTASFSVRLEEDPRWVAEQGEAEIEA